MVIQGRWPINQINYIRILTYFLELDHADNNRRLGFRRPDDFGSNVNLEMKTAASLSCNFTL